MSTLRDAEASRRFSIGVTHALVLFSVLSLSAIPFLAHGKISRAWGKIAEVAEPSQVLVSEIQLALALEAAGTRAYLLTTDPRYSAGHLAAREQRKRALSRLLASAPGLGADFAAESRRLAERLQPADALLDSLHQGRLTRGDYIARLPEQQMRYQDVTGTTLRLQQMITREAAARREEIRSAEQLASVLSIFSTVLAVVAVASVWRLGSRYRTAAAGERTARAGSEAARAEADRRRHEVERINASRSVFMRGVSHDLGNPLVAADCHLRTLEEQSLLPLAPSQAKAVSSARRSIDTAFRLIDDLVDLARAEAGELRLHAKTIDISAVAHRTAEEYRAAAEGKGLMVRTATAGVPPPIESDPERVRQILGNLLSNAIRYTPKGEITVRVNAGGYNRFSPGGADRIRVEVSDTGPGLGEDQRKRVFEEFYGIDTPGSPRGAGIGLAISRRLAVALGGKLAVESEPGRGATFILELPVRPSRPPAPRLTPQ